MYPILEDDSEVLKFGVPSNRYDFLVMEVENVSLIKSVLTSSTENDEGNNTPF